MKDSKEAIQLRMLAKMAHDLWLHTEEVKGILVDSEGKINVPFRTKLREVRSRCNDLERCMEDAIDLL